MNGRTGEQVNGRTGERVFVKLDRPKAFVLMMVLVSPRQSVRETDGTVAWCYRLGADVKPN